MTAFALTAVKLAAWLVTGSIALMASAVDSLVDAGASFVTLLGVQYAKRPPDSDHRFGHGKGEAVAAFTQATFLAGAAFVLAFQSIQRLVFPVALEAVGIGVILISGSLAVACVLVALQTWVVRETRSTAIKADRAHYITDIALNAAVLVALGVTHLTGWTRADPAFALAISGYMLWNAVGIGRDALEQLLDRELPAAERRKIETTVRACSGVRDIHDLRTHFRRPDLRGVPSRGRSGTDRRCRPRDRGRDGTRGPEDFPARVEATAHVEPFGIADTRLDDAVEGKSSAVPNEAPRASPGSRTRPRRSRPFRARPFRPRPRRPRPCARPGAFRRRVAIGIALNVGFVAIEAAYGVIANSIALLSDAGHNLGDALSLAAAWLASVLVQRGPTARFTYGLRSTSILAALFNAVVLLFVMVGIAWEAVQRFVTDPVAETTVSMT